MLPTANAVAKGAEHGCFHEARIGSGGGRGCWRVRSQIDFPQQCPDQYRGNHHCGEPLQALLREGNDHCRGQRHHPDVGGRLQRRHAAAGMGEGIEQFGVMQG